MKMGVSRKTFFLAAIFLLNNESRALLNLPPDTASINQKLQEIASGKISFDSALKIIPTILKQAESLKYKKGIANSYITKGIVFYKAGRCKEAIEAYEKCITYRDTIKEFKEIARAYNNIALAYSGLSQYDKALESHNKALEIRRRNNDRTGVAASIMNIGLIYELQGNYDKSQFNYFESLKIREELNDSDGISSCLNNIGTSFFYLNKPQKALEYYKKSAVISILRKNKLDIAKSYGNIAMINDDLKNYSEAIINYKNALDIFIELNSPFNIATCYNNIALVYTNLKNQDKAIEYHLKSLEIKEKIGDMDGTTTSCLNIGNIYLEKKKALEAKPYFDKGLKLSLVTGNRNLVMNAHKGLAELYRQLGDYKNCFINYQLYETQNDSLQKLERLAKISELEGMYNTEKTEKQLLYKNIELKEQGLVSAKRNTYLITTIIVLFFVIVFSMYLFFINKKTKILNSELVKKMAENELLMAEINHRIKNNLQIVSSLLKLPQKEISAESAKEVMSDTRERVNAIAIIHKILYENGNKTSVEMRKYLNELCNSLIKNLGTKGIKINTEIDNIILDVDITVPLGLVANELIINSIKHAFNNVEAPEITIKLTLVNNRVGLSVTDNGKKDVSNVLGSQGLSFGIKMIQSLAVQMDASFTAFYNKGMNFNFEFSNKTT